MSRTILILSTLLMIANPALAADEPDRSNLSYAENVIINTACAGALRKSDGAFKDCIRRQMDALQAHPTPDRSGLSPARNRAIEQKCDYLKRSSIGDYNQCLTQAMAAPAPAQATADSVDEGEMPNYAQVFTHNSEPGKDEPSAIPVAAPATLQPATDVLPKRPDHIDQQALSPQDLFKKVERSVFVVVATRSLADAKQGSGAIGSAVAVTDHLLLTNCHVVKNRSLIKIVHDSVTADAVLVAANEKGDRCVIKAESVTLSPVTGVRQFDNVVVGESVFAIGTPFFFERTLSEGLVSGLRRFNGWHVIQTTAAISHGSSGGGLFDERGNLVGITTLAFVGSGLQNLNFAVSAGDFWN